MAAGSGDILLTAPSSASQMLNCSNIICREGFFCDNDTNECVPQCGVWSQYSHSVNTAVDTLALLSALSGVIGGVGVLIVAALRRKKVYVGNCMLVNLNEQLLHNSRSNLNSPYRFVFPSTFVLYQVFSLMLLGMFDNK